VTKIATGMPKRELTLHGLKKVLLKLVKYFTTLDNWKKSPKIWIIAIFALTFLYSVLKTRGWLWKKDIKGEHVFLTGAGSGLGRYLALALGKHGCKLSLSDINVAGLEETKALLVSKGISATNINTFTCNVAKLEEI